MTYERPQGLVSRFRSLLHGIFSIWIRDRENESPEAVYEQAIAERTNQYRELKDAVAGILYMRAKLESEITERRAEIARLHDDVRRSVRRGQDDMAITLIAHKQVLFEDLERAEDELQGVRAEADEAKNNLVRFRDEIRVLVREKGRALATLANAKARRRLQLALDGLSVDAEMTALESVREYIARMTAERELEGEMGDAGMRSRLRALRDEARHDAARGELEQLKHEMATHVIEARATRGEAIPVATN
ncbi:MAG: PspA/IM30 family protein [Proteobacteria bacterium]|nr:PspA/IM30 family protein [Pseudomonadota bacterium]